MPRRSAQAASGSRRAVIETAVRDASVEGLEGLTIGRLAERLEMSKSGLFGLFGSKEELQLATLRAGIGVFVDEVWEPVKRREAGLPRLLALIDAWLGYLERGVMPGGCFMTTAAVEFDARPGPLRDAAARAWQRWLELLEADVAAALDAGELPAGTDAADVAFQLNAIASAASTGFQLSRDRAVFARARRTMRRLLGQPS